MRKKFRLLLLFLFFLSNSNAQVNNTKGANTTTFEYGSDFFLGYAKLLQGNKQFYIDTSGQYVFDTMIFKKNYGQNIVYPNEELSDLKYIITRRNNKYGLLNNKGKILLNTVYDTIETGYGDFIKVTKNNKINYADSTGKLLLPFQFDDAGYLDGVHFDVKLNGKWGIYDVQMNKLTHQAVYDKIDYCGGCGGAPEYFLAQKNGKWGVVDFDGKILAPFQYAHDHANMRSDYIEASFSKNSQSVLLDLKTGKEIAQGYTDYEIINDNLFFMAKDNNTKLINRKGEKILSDASYSDYTQRATKHGYIIISKDAGYGVLDSSGKIIIDAKYKDLQFINDTVFAFKLAGKWGIINDKNKVLLPNVYNEIEGDKYSSSYSMYPFIKIKRGMKYGLYQADKNIILPTVYDAIEAYFINKNDFYLQVTQAGKKGLMGDSGLIVLPIVYENFYSKPGADDIIEAKKDGLSGVINLQKKIIVPFQFEHLDIDDNHVNVFKNEKQGLYSINGKELVAAVYDEILQVSPTHFLLKKEKEYQLINIADTLSAKLIKIVADNIAYITDYEKNKDPFCLVAQIGEAYFLIDGSGKEIANTRYDFIGTFSSGLAPVTNKNKGGYINRQGKQITPLQYDAVEAFQNGIGQVFKKDSDEIKDVSKITKYDLLYGYIDSSGKEITPIEYDYYDMNENNFIKYNYLTLYKNYKFGLATVSGKIILPTQYEKIFINQDTVGGFLVSKDGKFGICNSDGKEIISCNYINAKPQSINQYTQETVLSWPILMQEDGKDGFWKYVNKDGTVLPANIKSIVEPSSYGIPAN